MMYSNIPVTLMCVLTEREGLLPRPAAQTWQARWQWWTDRPLTPEAAPVPGWRERWQRWTDRLRARETAPAPGSRELSLGEARPQAREGFAASKERLRA